MLRSLGLRCYCWLERVKETIADTGLILKGTLRGCRSVLINFNKIYFLPNSDIEQICDHILGRFGVQHFIVTGDVSGVARTGIGRGKRSYWQVVRHRLKLSGPQIRRENHDG